MSDTYDWAKDDAYMLEKFADLDANDRSWQRTDTVYVTPDGSAFFTPDGEGRIWYDSEEEAMGPEGPGLVRVRHL